MPESDFDGANMNLNFSFGAEPNYAEGESNRAEAAAMEVGTCLTMFVKNLAPMRRN